MIVLALSALVAQDFLATATSPVFETALSPTELAARAETCVAQHLGSGAVGGELIISRNADEGMIVARSAVSYRNGLLTWQMRSRVTVEGREGRFRIEHSSIERFNSQAGGWSPVGKWRGSGWQKAEAALQATSQNLAACIAAEPTESDW